MIVHVFHNATHVATIAAPGDLNTDEALEFAWRWTQNVDGSWSVPGSADYHGRVKIVAPLREHEGRTYGHRSSAVGDIFTIGTRTFVVASTGFRELTEVTEAITGKPHVAARRA